MQRIATGLDIYAEDVVLGHTICTSTMTGVDDMPGNFWSDVPALFSRSGTTFCLVLLDSETKQQRDVTSDWAAADGIFCAVVKGSYLYVLLTDNATTPNTQRVYRYLLSNIGAGGTLMTFSGSFVLATSDANQMMTTDGTYFYFNFKAGNSSNDYDIAKYSLSGTAFTYVSTTSLGASANVCRLFHVRASDGHYLTKSTTEVYRRYNSSGTLQVTSANGSGDTYFHYICGWLYSGIRISSAYTFLTRIIIE